MSKSKYALIGMAAIVAYTAVVAVTTWKLKRCSKPLKPIATAQIPETKPAETKEKRPPKPEIRWEKETVLDTATLNAAEKKAFESGYEKGWEICAEEHNAYLKPKRFTVTDTTAHTKDSIEYDALADTFRVVHMGILPTVEADEKEGQSKHQPFLHFGLTGWFDQPTEFWGTIPLPRERKMFYMPHRGGVSYQPKSKDWRVVLEWGLL